MYNIVVGRKYRTITKGVQNMNTDEMILKIYEELQEVRKDVKNTKKAIKETEKLLLDEIQFNRTAVEKQIAKVEQNMEELKQYYRITKLENDNTAILLNLIKQLQNDVEELKRKTA